MAALFQRSFSHIISMINSYQCSCCYRITVIDRADVAVLSGRYVFIWSHPLIDFSFFTLRSVRTCVHAATFPWMCLNTICISFVSFRLQCELHKRRLWRVYHACGVLTCVSEKLKFTPTPQPAQCLELDNDITIQCSAKGRENPTIRWTKAGVCTAGLTSAHNGLNRIRNDY